MLRRLALLSLVLGGCASVSGLDDFVGTAAGGGGAGGAGASDVGAGGAAGPSCGDAASVLLAKNQHCYLYAELGLTWDEAHQDCTGRGAGWELASITSQEELDFIDAAFDHPDDVWIGGLADASALPWVWSWTNGDPWTYEAWSSDEPNNSGLCLELEQETGQARFNDTACDRIDGHICERPAQ